MARDAELDRLKAAQDQAFQRQQNAYDAQQRAWEHRSSKRDAMNRAYETKQRAWEAQNASWQDYQSVRSSNGPRIDSLKAQQEQAYQNMVRSYEQSRSSWDFGDRASAKSYSEDGKRYKEESQGYVAERRRLVDEIRSAKARHEPNQQAFQQAKRDFESKRREYQDAKADHERKQADFKQAKAEREKARDAFRRRLEQVKAEAQKRRDDRRSLAEKAGVPFEYRDKVWISKKPDGAVNIYFGGVGQPDGPGHGHYVLDSSRTVTYKRDPFDPHGAQNFQENRRESATQRMAQMAMNQWAKSQTTPWSTQYEDDEFKVQAKSGYDYRHNAIVTDVLIYDKQNKREHYHLVIDEHGTELFSEWRENRGRS